MPSLFKCLSSGAFPNTFANSFVLLNFFTLLGFFNELKRQLLCAAAFLINLIDFKYGM